LVCTTASAPHRPSDPHSNGSASDRTSGSRGSAETATHGRTEHVQLIADADDGASMRRNRRCFLGAVGAARSEVGCGQGA
jgi:hypothetical protein